MPSDLTLICDVAEAVPRKILDIMNVQGLTRENVASHLQVSFLFEVLSKFLVWHYFLALVLLVYTSRQ
jgi:SHAQKYF class myb-like DNA-binding protein